MVVIDNDSVYIESILDRGIIDNSIYWHIDKQEGVYSFKDFEVISRGEGYSLKAIPFQQDFNILFDQESVSIDIQVSKITILSRIFSRGGGIGD